MKMKKTVKKDVPLKIVGKKTKHIDQSVILFAWQTVFPGHSLSQHYDSKKMILVLLTMSYETKHLGRNCKHPLKLLIPAKFQLLTEQYMFALAAVEVEPKHLL
jgi:hypothetical protein